DHSRGGDHGPVTAEHQHQIDLFGDVRIVDDRHRATSLVLDSFTFDFGKPDQSDAMLVQPAGQPAEGFERVRLMRLDDHTNALYFRFNHFANVSQERADDSGGWIRVSTTCQKPERKRWQRWR